MADGHHDTPDRSWAAGRVHRGESAVTTRWRSSTVGPTRGLGATNGAAAEFANEEQPKLLMGAIPEHYAQWIAKPPPFRIAQRARRLPKPQWSLSTEA